MPEQVTNVKMTFRSTVSPQRDSIVAHYGIDFDGATYRPHVGRSMKANWVPERLVLDDALSDLFAALGDTAITELEVEMVMAVRESIGQ